MKHLGFAYNPTSEMALQLRERALGWCARHDITAWAEPAVPELLVAIAEAEARIEIMPSFVTEAETSVLLPEMFW